MSEDSRIETESRRRRVARAVGAVAGVVGIAGCLDGDDGQSDTPSDVPGGAATPTGDTVREPTDTDDGLREFEVTTPEEVSVSPHLTTRPPGVTRSPTPTPTCEERAEPLRQELAELREKEEEVRRELRAEEFYRNVAKARRDWYTEGYDEGVIERARDVADRVADSVVKVRKHEADELAPWDRLSGTGWFRTPHQVVTNGHIAKNAADTELTGQGQSPEPVSAVTRNGTQITLTLVDGVWAPGLDIAVFRTDHEGTPLSVGTAAEVTPGAPLLQVGHPASFGEWVPTLGRYLYDVDSFDWKPPDYLPYPAENEMLTSLPSQGGSSGSPVVTLEGDVVGMMRGEPSQGLDLHFDDSWETFVYDFPMVTRGLSSQQRSESIEEYVDRVT